MDKSRVKLMAGALKNSGSGESEFARELAFDLVQRLTSVADDETRPQLAAGTRRLIRGLPLNKKAARRKRL